MLYFKFQASEQSGSAEDFEFFLFIYFYGLNIGPPGAVHLAHRDLHLNKLGKGPQGHAPYQISSI